MKKSVEMKIITPPNFFQVIENKHLLLDTSVFIDTSLNLRVFGDFLNKLKDNGNTLVSLDAVKIEFLRGAGNITKYEEKKQLFEKICEACLPIIAGVFDNVYSLIQSYKEDGKGISITDFLLGATLMYYKKNLFLLTKNTTEFPLSIFKLKTLLNLSHKKGLHSYGVYSFEG